MMIQTQKLEYPDHSQEIRTLNQVIAVIRANYPQGYPPQLHPTVGFVLKRLDELMMAQKAVLKVYDQHEQRT